VLPFRKTIDQDIHLISCRQKGPGGLVKAILLADDDCLTLVDSGFSDADGELILKNIKEIGRRSQDLKRCIITHKHADHVGGLKRLRSEVDFEIIAHEAEVAAIDDSTGLHLNGTLKDGQVLPACGGLQVIHMPGHTAGSISLFLPKHRTLLAGDTIFSAGQWLMFPPPYLCDDPDQANQSVRRLVKMNLDIQSVVVGHGEDLHEKGKERLNLMLCEKRAI
jgi:glyoxylase-like metal-dependent hydrolase (beta-lactamase superfamily II)